MNERYTITTNWNEVSIIDTENENLLILGLNCEDNKEIATYLKEELHDIVKLLNEQDKQLKKVGIILP